MEEVSLREYIEVLLRGKKMIGIITTAAVIVAIIFSFIMPPVYEARTTLLANPIGSQQSKEITNSTDVLDTISQYPEMTLETYRNQFLNAEVVQATIQELNLRDENGNPMKIRSFREKVTVEVVEGTNLIRVTVQDKNPELAANIANTLNERFINFITTMTRNKGMQAVEAITEQLEAEKKALDEQAKKKRDYLINSKDIDELNQEIITLRDQMTMYKQSIIDTDKQIQSDIKTLETLEKSGVKSANVNISNIKGKIQLNQVEELRTNNAIVTNNANTKIDEEELNNAQSKNFNSNNINNVPSNQAADMSISQEIEFDISSPSALEDAMLAAQKTQIETRLVQNVSEKEVLEQKIEEIQKRLTELRSTLATEEYKYNEVIRNYQLAEESFQAYQTRKNEAEKNAAADIGKASIIISSPAVVPDIPSAPNKVLNIAIAMVLGLMIGVFGVFFKEYWRSTSKLKS